MNEAVKSIVFRILKSFSANAGLQIYIYYIQSSGRRFAHDRPLLQTSVVSVQSKCVNYEMSTG